MCLTPKPCVLLLSDAPCRIIKREPKGMDLEGGAGEEIKDGHPQDPLDPHIQHVLKIHNSHNLDATDPVSTPTYC